MILLLSCLGGVEILLLSCYEGDVILLDSCFGEDEILYFSFGSYFGTGAGSLLVGFGGSGEGVLFFSGDFFFVVFFELPQKSSIPHENAPLSSSSSD